VDGVADKVTDEVESTIVTDDHVMIIMLAGCRLLGHTSHRQISTSSTYSITIIMIA
jgi:hypothetical protein